MPVFARGRTRIEGPISTTYINRNSQIPAPMIIPHKAIWLRVKGFRKPALELFGSLLPVRRHLMSAAVILIPSLFCAASFGQSASETIPVAAQISNLVKGAGGANVSTVLGAAISAANSATGGSIIPDATITGFDGTTIEGVNVGTSSNQVSTSISVSISSGTVTIESGTQAVPGANVTLPFSETGTLSLTVSYYLSVDSSGNIVVNYTVSGTVNVSGTVGYNATITRSGSVQTGYTKAGVQGNLNKGGTNSGTVSNGQINGIQLILTLWNYVESWEYNYIYDNTSVPDGNVQVGDPFPVPDAPPSSPIPPNPE